VPESVRKECKLRTSIRLRSSLPSRGIPGVSAQLEGFRPATENRGVPGLNRDLASGSVATSCGVAPVGGGPEAPHWGLGRARPGGVAGQRALGAPDAFSPRPRGARSPATRAFGVLGPARTRRGDAAARASASAASSGEQVRSTARSGCRPPPAWPGFDRSPAARRDGKAGNRLLDERPLRLPRATRPRAPTQRPSRSPPIGRRVTPRA
jgi:hypothetical protein